MCMRKKIEPDTTISDKQVRIKCVGESEKQFRRL